MSSEAITRNDLTNILNEVLPPTPSEYRKLLWTNPNPTSSFAAQTVSLDLSDYDEVEVDIATYGTYASTTTESFKFKVGVGGLPSGAANTIAWRYITPTTTGVEFGTGYETRTYGANGTQDNTKMVPQRIYGIKYERVAPPQLEDLTIIESFGTYNNVPATGTWTLPNTKSYKRLFLFFPVWGTYNSTTLASTPVIVNANQSTITFTNWTNRTGGVVANTTLSATVFAIRMEF